jgi:hypothetical protein
VSRGSRGSQLECVIGGDFIGHGGEEPGDLGAIQEGLHGGQITVKARKRKGPGYDGRQTRSTS